ncbi:MULTISPECIES: hypothetical protein [Pseudomonas]|uniref:KAP NTPase domain-containing protein n=1 Tax=Pseudomonas putida S13.1.2 TaxID=1384061 RepID=A0AAU8RRI8_PSEPU|nr:MULTISPECIES: hypothetical protein [Pseudomonas]AJQ46189.1 hypothetical protein N805_02660 [Pseudomonas putida S13.1.2]
MTLAHCKHALLGLIDEKENKVIALSGKWGTGKTELWKQVREATGDKQAKEAVSASLFGVSTIAELKLKIAEGLTDKLDKSYLDSVKTGVTAVKKVLKSVNSSFSVLDELSLLAVPYMLKGRFIVIDDIERKHAKLTIDEILGFIDECVQKHDCRILLILNSDKLKDQEIWGQIREKVVDQEIKLETSPTEAFDIAHKLTSCSWPEPMRAALLPLRITNIRVIRKIIKVANQLLGQDPAIAPLLLKRVLPSISLLGGIHYEAVEDAPSKEFVLDYQAHRTSTLVSLRGKQNTPLSKQQQNQERWHRLMTRVGISSTDELEAMILAYLDSGIVDSTNIQHFVTDYLRKSDRLEARNKAITFEEHLSWHPQLSEQDLIIELEHMLPSAGLLDMKRLSNLIPSIDQLTGDQQLGLAFIEKWRAQFQADHPDGVTEDWLHFNDHSFDQLHPLIQDEIESARSVSLDRFTVLGLLQDLMKGNDWGISEKQFLRSVTPREFEKEIRAASGSDLQLLIQKGFDLVKDTGAPERNHGHAPDSFLQACRSIVDQEPHSRLASMLRREGKIAGVDIRFESEDLALLQGQN